MWTCDPDLEALARETLEAEALELVAGVDPAVHANGLLEAAGTLVALDLSVPELSPEAARAARAAVATLDGSELDEAHLCVLELASLALTLDEELVVETLAPLLDALRVRDRVELRWMGADALGMQGDLSEDLASSRLAFDASVEPILWQLVPLGEARSAELEWMAPGRWGDFWWRSRGAELAGALDEPSRRGEVLKVFPDAKAHLEALHGMGACASEGPALALVAPLPSGALAPPRALAAKGRRGATEVPFQDVYGAAAACADGARLLSRERLEVEGEACELEVGRASGAQYALTLIAPRTVRAVMCWAGARPISLTKTEDIALLFEGACPRGAFELVVDTATASHHFRLTPLASDDAE